MNRVPPDRLLSVSPYFSKKVLPKLWLGLAAFLMAVALIGSGPGPSSFGVTAVLAIVFGISYVLMRMIAGGLADSVRDGGDYWLVRIGDNEERIPMHEIEHVKEFNYRRQPPRVELVLKYPGKFGRVISFIPIGATMAHFVPFSKTALFHELEERVRIAHAEHPTEERKIGKD